MFPPSSNWEDLQPSSHLSHSLFPEHGHLNCSGKADVCVLSAQLRVCDTPSPQTLQGLICLSTFYTLEALGSLPMHFMKPFFRIHFPN